MGSKTSTEKHQTEYSSSHGQNPDPNNIQTHAKTGQQMHISSKNGNSVSQIEIKSSQKNHSVKSAALLQKSDQREKILHPSTDNRVQQRKLHSELKTETRQKSLRKSQSFDNLSNQTNVITVGQLLNRNTQRRYNNKSPSSQISTQKHKDQTVKNPSTTAKSAKIISPNLQLVLIPSNEIQNPREIGKGNFGTVYHALYKGTRDVALKTLNKQNEHPSGYTFDDYDDTIHELLYEANIMKQLTHPNLLRILGVTFFGEKQQLSLVTDFMRNGSLLDYLRNYREIFLKADIRSINKKLNKFGRQIFEAMLYLEERNIIHRDLAARNCLIGQDDTLKVGDFGLTTLTDCGLYKGTDHTICAPRWTSPEALFSSKYSSRSDVWSYGITLWEIYSLGERPFGNTSNFAVQVILKNSSEDFSRHFPQPQPFGSNEIYTHIFLPCITYNVAMRPRFRDLKERLSNILKEKE